MMEKQSFDWKTTDTLEVEPLEKNKSLRDSQDLLHVEKPRLNCTSLLSTCVAIAFILAICQVTWRHHPGDIDPWILVATASEETSFPQVLQSSQGTVPNEVVSKQATFRELSKGRYLFPAMTSISGASNQLLEYMTAMAIAKIVNRTLCLAPFAHDPKRHQFPSSQSHDYGLKLQERYNLTQLSRYLPTASMEECMEACGGKVDIFWELQPMRETEEKHWNEIASLKVDGKSNFRGWATPSDVAHDFGTNPEKCMALGGLFPGLRWRGPLLAVAAFLDHTDAIAQAAAQLHKLAFGSRKPFLAVHWRFRESGGCKKGKEGLCFFRCNDGANPAAPEMAPRSPKWKNLTSCPRPHAPGVIVEPQNVVAAIYDVAQAANLTAVYVATDGWLRKDGCKTVKLVVKELRRRGLAVAGLWQCPDLPGFLGRKTPSNIQIGQMMSLQKDKWELGNEIVSLVEQEVCIQSTAFLGSGISTWSIVVQRSRLAKRRAMKLQAIYGAQHPRQEDVQSQDVFVGDELMKDDFSAGVVCYGGRQPKAWHVMAPNETLPEDETVDSWLDDVACEGQQEKGGKCEVAICL